MTPVDWTISADAEVAKVIDQVARRCAREWSDVVDLDEARQEVELHLATDDDAQAAAGQPALLDTVLWRDMVDKLRVLRSRAQKHLSYEVLVEGVE